MITETKTVGSEPEYYRPFQVEVIYGISQATIRNYIRWGWVKGATNGRTMVLVNATDLKAKIKRVESGEPWDHVFCSQVVNGSLSLATTAANAVTGGNDDL